jgi:hypothetical protein
MAIKTMVSKIAKIIIITPKQKRPQPEMLAIISVGQGRFTAS